MNAKKCKRLRAAVRQLVQLTGVDPEPRYEVRAKGVHKEPFKNGLEGFRFREWYTIGLADCARKRYQTAKKEWKRNG